MEKDKMIGRELEKVHDGHSSQYNIHLQAESSRQEMEGIEKKMIAMRETLDMMRENDGDRYED